MTSTSTPQPTIRWRSERPAHSTVAEHGATEQQDEETVHQAAPTPIYTALARQWAAERKAVPGHFDQEWIALVDYATWRRRQPRTRPQGS